MKSPILSRGSPRIGLFTITRAAGVTLLASLFFSGCQSAPSSRIQENSDLFQSLDVLTQGMIRQGHIDHGFSSELVTLALGKPNRVEFVTTRTGLVETWTYPNFFNATSDPLTLGVSHGGPSQSGSLRSSSTGIIDLNRDSGGTKSLRSSLGEWSEIAVGTLVIELFEDRVVTIRLEP